MLPVLPDGKGAAREMERLRHTYRRRLHGLGDDELEEETRRVDALAARLKDRLHRLESSLAAMDALEEGATPDERAAREERRHESRAAHQRLYLELTTDLFRKQAALSAEELRRWGGE